MIFASYLTVHVPCFVYPGLQKKSTLHVNEEIVLKNFKAKIKLKLDSWLMIILFPWSCHCHS